MKRMIPGLEAAELDAVSAKQDAASTLPTRAYTDPTLYAREEMRLFRAGWMPVARVDQVAEPGDYLSLTLLDQPLLVVRGQDGIVRVLSNVCLHRAARLVEGAGNRKLFTCPYHAWAYDTEGQLVRAPLMNEVDGFAEKQCKLPALRTEIWQGFVLVNLNGDAAPFAPSVTAYDARFAGWGLERMVVARTLHFDSPWNWKVLVENFMEAYHHIAIHSETFEPVFHAKDSRIPDADGPWSILHMPTDHEPETGGLPMVPGLEDWQQRDLFATAIFPHFLLGIQGNATAWYQIFPTSVDEMLLKIHICVPASSTKLADFETLADGAAEMLSYIHNEDIAANDMVWAGLNAPLTGQGRLSPLERSIWQFNQWWLNRVDG